MLGRFTSLIVSGSCVAAAWARLLGSETDFTPIILTGIGFILLDVNKKEKADGS